MKDKICFVVQRYGLEVNGGAELQCRLFAEHLKKYYEIDVVTTKAIDYISWKNEYKKSEEEINGVHVIRFPVVHERKPDTFNAINSKFLEGNLPQEEEMKWIDEQGPAVPRLIRYLREHKEDYEVFVFFTYLYYPTVMGIKEVADKAIVIPEAHDEPFLRMKVFDDVFLKPQAFFFNTEEERNFVHNKYNNAQIPCDIGGIGLDVPEQVSGEEFKKKYGLDNYIIYVGRIDEGKNCHRLFQYFEEYKKRNDSDVKLVLLGKAVIPVPEREDVISLGFVSDEDKFNGVAGARLLILPSEFESLSMVVLEAMSIETPVLVNGKCSVLKGHCIKSNGALYYENYFEFEGTLNYLLSHDEEVSIMKENAKKYALENYQWDVVIGKLRNLIEMVRN